MQVNLDFEFEVNKAVVSSIEKKINKTIKKTADALLTEVKNAQVMPFDTGTMQNDSTFIKKGRFINNEKTYYIVVQTPYAARLYFHPEYNFRRNNNANAQGKWFEPWINGDKKDFASDKFAELLKEELG